jgi:hypothetical protein
MLQSMRASILLSLFLLVMCTSHISAQRDILFSMCDFPLSEMYRQANLSFTQAYRIRIDSEGNPDKIDRVLGKEIYVSEKLAETCISKWKFIGFAQGNVFLTSFRWDHGLGWTRVSISGNGIYRKVVSEREEPKPD